MGSKKSKFRDFAIAFWKTSEQDLERAEDALKEGLPICSISQSAVYRKNSKSTFRDGRSFYQRS